MKYVLIIAWFWTAGEHEGKTSFTQREFNTYDGCEVHGLMAESFTWHNREVIRWVCIKEKAA